MIRDTRGKTIVLVTALLLTFAVAPGVADATTPDQVIAQVDQEYANGQMDAVEPFAPGHVAFPLAGASR